MSLVCVIASQEETVAVEGRKTAIHFVGVLHVRNVGPHWKIFKCEINKR